MPTLHFISGLPRSGSTLLAGLLRQNPRFAAAMTGPVGGLVTTLLNSMSPQNETAVCMDWAKRSRRTSAASRHRARRRRLARAPDPRGPRFRRRDRRRT
jgi:hypothetical protein